MQQALPDNAIGGLISPNQIAKIGECPQEYQSQRPKKPSAGANSCQQICNTHTGIFSGAKLSGVNRQAGLGQTGSPIYRIRVSGYNEDMLWRNRAERGNGFDDCV
jgi:hypothetical protein